MSEPIRAARRDLSDVRPAWGEAMRALPPETVARLARRVTIVARQYPRADDVESLAAVTVAGFYTAEPDNDAGSIDRAASAACRAASRVVSLAYEGVDSLDAWAEVAPEMVEACAARTDVATGLPRAWSPAPDAAYETTDADVIAAAIASVPSVDGRRILRDAGRAYAAHGDRRCPVCESAGGMGRRVSLAGILAHTRGLTASDSDFHVLRRQMLAALRAVDVAGVKAEHYYPRPSLGRAAVSLDYAPQVEAPGKRETAARGLPRTDLVTVTSADGTRVTRTEQHYADIRAARTAESAPPAAPRPGTLAADGLAGFAPRGPESRVIGWDVPADDDTRRASRIGERIAGAPSAAVRAPQRRRSGGTGAYGSQVPARLSRG